MTESVHVLIFKYLSPAGAKQSLERDERLLLKFNLPRNYNDPYELFLQPSVTLESAELCAFYEYFFGRVVQAPMSCFSRRPDSVPMWAHYAHDAEGVVLGFDEDALSEHFVLAYLADVAYSDRPAAIDSEMIKWAFATGKRRHALRLMAMAHRAAFFTKRLEWAYECERRLVVASQEIENREGLLLASIAPEAVRFVVVGSKSSTELRSHCERFASASGIPVLRALVGKRHYELIFQQLNGRPLCWTGGDFSECPVACAMCGEPTPEVNSDGRCVWCRIDDDVRRSAARRSMLAATLYFGLDRGLPLEFADLNPKGRGAAKWIADAPRRRNEAMATDMRLVLELFAVMKESGLLKDGMFLSASSDDEER